MHNPTIETQIKYITNAAGEKTEVIVPVELWQTLMELIQPIVSGLHSIDENEPKASILGDLKASLKQSEAGQTYPHSIDENEPKASILGDLKASLKQSEAGQTYPLSELWDDIET